MDIHTVPNIYVCKSVCKSVCSSNLKPRLQTVGPAHNIQNIDVGIKERGNGGKDHEDEKGLQLQCWWSSWLSLQYLQELGRIKWYRTMVIFLYTRGVYAQKRPAMIHWVWLTKSQAVELVSSFHRQHSTEPETPCSVIVARFMNVSILVNDPRVIAHTSHQTHFFRSCWSVPYPRLRRVWLSYAREHSEGRQMKKCCNHAEK